LTSSKHRLFMLLGNNFLFALLICRIIIIVFLIYVSGESELSYKASGFFALLRHGDIFHNNAIHNNAFTDEQLHFFDTVPKQVFAILVPILYFFRMHNYQPASCSPGDRFAS